MISSGTLFKAGNIHGFVIGTGLLTKNETLDNSYCLFPCILDSVQP